MTDIIIRDMTVADVEAVAKLGNNAPELKTNDDDMFWSKDVLERWVKGGDVLLVADAQGKVVGFQLTQFHEPSREGYLSDIVIDPDWRGRGIGSRLVEEAERRLVSKGADYIYGLTQLHNDKIHALLEKQGYKKGSAFYWFEKYPKS
jgi:ribosomal protein S18 acetylase RimI-like enzyme